MAQPDGGAASAPAFVGRERELAAVGDALRSAPAVVLIEGEAGIGKTALVRECLLAPPVRDLRSLTAVCPPLTEPFPLGPLVEALHRRHVHDLELSPLAGALRPLFPEWADQLPPAPEPLDDPRATRHRLYRAMVELVTATGVDVLVIEDAHWADAATLEFLVMLCAAADRTVSVVITCRSAEMPDTSPLTWLTTRAAAHTASLRLTLEPLTVDETSRLVASIFSTTDVSAEFVTFLHQRTEGVPLALEESVSLLRDRGDIVRRGGEWSRRALDELRVPPTVRDSVLERVRRLSPSARRVLEAAAVLADPADEATLARVGELSDDDAGAGLAQLLSAGLVREAEPGRFVCRHVLAARAVEEAVPVSERRRRHHHAAHALQQSTSPPVGRLSRHFREAGDVEQWSRHAEAAAELALASGDDRAAVVVLLDLLTSAEHPQQRFAHLARLLGEAATWGAAALGELADEVAATLRAALDGTDPSASGRGELRLLLGRLLLQLGDFDAGSEQIEAAAADLDERPELAARAMISLAYPRGHEWPLRRHQGWLEQASRLTPRVPAEDRVWLAVDRASVLLMMGDDTGWQAAAEMGDGAATLFERRQVARGRMNAGHAAIGWGRDSEGYDRLDAAIELLGTTGYRRLVNSALLTRAHLEWHRGSWDGLAERVTRLAEAEDTLPEALLEARTVLAFLDLATGRRTAAEETLRDVLDRAERHGLVDMLVEPAAALGRVRLADGDADGAVEVTDVAASTIDRKNMWVWGADLLPVHVDALIRSGRTEHAAELVERFGAGVPGTDAPAPEAALRACGALLAEARGAFDEAVDGFAGAARTWAALPRPYAELLTDERRGAAMLRAGRDADALSLLGEAQQRLTALGARWDADRVARLLRERGVEVSRAWHGGRRGYGDELSPREREVCDLVARGLTNRQVAEALFLSPRTVDRHLGAAMRKLGVTSRTALAVAVTDVTDETDENIG
ncbi:regulatory LuxR family protein [Haloactinopolyspora alba]|uniref:Regulatory LuxR family protein n=1 Tax=Haloactinopolyspora alba TaxID=648780 RepID=A0A2P8DFX0_9ACTN|nr:AAA family ATPase [Haloactinopolyspora alba]PSK96110.1 regulatory LuxR family protein [Haloactinopolyspora alba]